MKTDPKYIFATKAQEAFEALKKEHAYFNGEDEFGNRWPKEGTFMTSRLRSDGKTVDKFYLPTSNPKDLLDFFENSQNNYNQLLQCQNAGLLPQIFEILPTIFDKRGFITQQKVDRPFLPAVDMLKPAVKDAVKQIIKGIYDGSLPQMDFVPRNLGWINDRGVDKLVLFDFVELKEYDYRDYMNDQNVFGPNGFSGRDETLKNELDPRTQSSKSDTK